MLSSLIELVKQRVARQLYSYGLESYGLDCHGLDDCGLDSYALDSYGLMELVKQQVAIQVRFHNIGVVVVVDLADGASRFRHKYTSSDYIGRP